LIKPITEPFIDWCCLRIASDDAVIVDTETTGKYGEVIDLAIIDAKGEELYNKLLRPSCLKPGSKILCIDPDAEAVHHISEAMLASAPTILDEWYEVCQIVAGRTIITYNARFDSERITYSLRKHGMHLCPSCRWEYECAMLGYAEFYDAPPRWEGAGPAWQPLGTACSQQGIRLNPKFMHRALSDCLATLALIRQIAAAGENSRRYRP